ncbi:hypothetical protein LUZ61_018136 [Rhynchospora tenuis]|uniref:Pentatricopeptide repeat-containing protein n=1 Tax=Rhynchospora tenuis TaxID=198213 RepID=A0AAD5Z8Q4_9POAL|nr:hypothetical protein LUZ61_018136 [Rhynchospora tenuis]
MSQRDVTSWTTMISSYAQQRNYDGALQVFQKMLVSDTCVIPNEFTCSTVLRCCTHFGEDPAFKLGVQLHGLVLKYGFALNLVVSSSLLEFYSGIGEASLAHKVFDEMAQRDVISCTGMISCLLEAKEWEKAVGVYNNMIRSSIKPTEFTFAKFLSSCASHCWDQRGKMIHSQSIRHGVEHNPILKTILVNMYCKFGDMTYALRVFRLTKDYDVTLFTSIISGLLKARKYEEAISMFREMESSAIICPNSLTYAGIISACASNMEVHLGKQIQSRIIKVGLEHDLSIGNSLLNLYNKCATDMQDLKCTFHQINEPNVVSWTTLISAFVNHGHDLEAFTKFSEMRASGVEPTSYTLSTILKSCNSPETLVHAVKVHAYIIKTSMDSVDISIGNSLIHVYSRFNRQGDAWVVFDTIPLQRDALTYTSLAGGLNKGGLYKSALDIVPFMMEEAVKVDGHCIACFLSAAANSAALGPGRQLHCLSVKTGLESAISVSNSLLDMYSKCKRIKEAKEVFAGIKEPTVVTYNVLISGLVNNGLIPEALLAFEDMRLVGVKPDQITFLVVLQACNIDALVDVGIEYFKSMREIHGVDQLSEHYKLLLDLLGRAGRLEEAACMVETMPYEMDLSICKSLLGWCRLHKNLVFGEYVARKGIELEPSDPRLYRLLAGLYDVVGRQDLTEQMHVLMREKGIRVPELKSHSLIMNQNEAGQVDMILTH